MESSEHSTDRSEAETALAEAQAARNRMAGNLVLPSYFYTSIGAAIAVQIAAAALAFGIEQPWAWVSLIAGLVIFAVVAVVQLARFRRLNGVWLGGLASRVVLGTANLTSAVYAAAFAASIWAVLVKAWWLVPVTAIIGGGGYAWCGRRWWRSYQDDPDQRWREDSKALLLILPVLASIGLVALLVGH
jgi:hypothetical protein